MRPASESRVQAPEISDQADSRRRTHVQDAEDIGGRLIDAVGPIGREGGGALLVFQAVSDRVADFCEESVVSGPECQRPAVCD